jgi:hypothetical protein
VADHQGVRPQGGVNAFSNVVSQPVIASASKAIHGAASGKLDCFVALLLAMTGYDWTRSSFCRQRVALTTSGIGVSGKLVFQLVTPTSPT